MAKKDKALSPQAEYLAKIGVPETEIDLSVPDIDALHIADESPCKWVDRDGNEPPAGLQLFMVAADTRDKSSAMANARKKGYRRVTNSEARFRWLSRDYNPDDIVMVRTREQAAAYRQAQELKERKRRGRKTRHSSPAGVGDLTVEEYIAFDQQVQLRERPSA